MPFWSREQDNEPDESVPEDSRGDSASDDPRMSSQGDLDGDADNPTSMSESESTGPEQREEPHIDAPEGAGEQSDVRQQLVRRLHAATGERRRVALRVRRGLGVAQLPHQRQELARVVALEGDDKLLVVEAVGVGGVELYGRVLAADADVLVH